MIDPAGPVLSLAAPIAMQQDAQFIFSLIIFLLVILCWWALFEKARHGGWKALIPIYNFLVMLEVAGWPWIAALLFLIPLVNILAALLLNLSLARSFGRGALFGIGLWLLPVIFLPILAFGGSRYVGPGGR